MYDPMADIINPGATRDQGAEGNVRSGMELLTWEYPVDEWQRHLNARARRRWLAGLAVRKWQAGYGPRPRTRPFPTTATAVGSVFSAGFIAALIADSTIGITGAAVGLVGTFVGHFATRNRNRPIDMTEAPEVLFTSTGVIFGGHARRWRGYRYQLSEVRMRFGELTHLEPTYLELEFSSGWRETTLSIPVPSPLQHDVAELTARLQDMMLGRALGTTATTALKGADLEDRG